MADELYALAAGYDVPLISLVRITAISVSGNYFAGPQAILLYDNGEEKVVTNGLITDEGYPNVVWREGILFYEQYTYLSSTYCNNTRTGPVTIYTTLGGVSYVRRNAIMTLPKPKAMRGKIWYTDADIMFTRLRPAA